MSRYVVRGTTLVEATLGYNNRCTSIVLEDLATPWHPHSMSPLAKGRSSAPSRLGPSGVTGLRCNKVSGVQLLSLVDGVGYYSNPPTNTLELTGLATTVHVPVVPTP